MSEFSDSYHLHTADTRAAVRLIRRSGLYGMVLPSSGRYVPFLVEGLDEVGSPLDVIIEHNTQVLIHYAFGDDHGCWIRVFEGSSAVATLSYVEPGSLRPDHRATSLDADNLAPALTTLLDGGIIDEVMATRLTELARHLVVHDIGPRVARALGLEHVAWLSCADLTYQSKRALQQRFPDAVFVNVRKRGKALGPRSFEELMALPVPWVALSAAQEVTVRRHYRYWTEFGDFDNETSEGFWMYEHYRSVLPTRYRYLADQLMNLYGKSNRTQDTLDTLRAIIGLAGPEIEWDSYLRGF